MTNPTSQTTQYISLWYDTTSDPSAPCWIVSLEDSADETTRTLSTHPDQREARQRGQMEADKRGLELRHE